MPRNLYVSEPVHINEVASSSKNLPLLEIASSNQNKIREFERILDNFEIIPKDIDIDEVQSLNPLKVLKEKAKKAWEINQYNPIVVEDTSLEIMGLNGRPGTFVKDFTNDVEMRRMVATEWLKGRDRRAIARVIIGIYDGKEFHFREGKTDGKISEYLKGTNGFGWDDMFIPVDSENYLERTFAEMSDDEKDKYSMRKKALIRLKKEPFKLNYPVLMINEPYEQELDRMRIHKLQDEEAKNFAFKLESIESINSPNNNYIANNYSQIEYEKNKYFNRFNTKLDSPSLGVIMTDIDRSSIKLYRNGEPIIWQMGPERRMLALAQRAEFFLETQSQEIYSELVRIEKESIPPRNNNRSITIENALGTTPIGDKTKTIALKEIGYKKVSSKQEVSRTHISRKGLFNKIGKYPRSIYGIGSMPPISGWRDVLVTSAIGHMPVFTHRNSLNAADPLRQIDLINSAKSVLRNLGLTEENYKRVERNIGAAIGCGNIEEEMKIASKLFYESNTKLFRIYTINSDPRVIEMASRLRSEFGDEIEIFVGQIADKEQALRLISKEIRVDGLVFGHGGGMQCTSATNGMALTTLEEIYDVVTDPRFNNTTIVAEGGVGRSVGGLIVMGVDLILSNQKLVRGTIELSDIYFEHKSGKLCHPYHGSASAPTMLIESSNPKLLETRMYLAGRAKKIEGKPGYMFFREKANSMVFYINEYKHYAARTLADLGVNNFFELRDFLLSNKSELLRIISTEANYTGNPHPTT